MINTESPPMEHLGAPSSPVGTWLSVVTHLDPRYGGLSAVVPELSASVAAVTRQPMEIAAFCTPGELYEPHTSTLLSVSEWPTSRMEWWKNRTLHEDFAATVRRADGVHVHGLWEESTRISCRIAQAERRPFVISAHGMLERWALRNKAWKKRVYAALIERANLNRAACLHALTQAEAADYREFGCTAPIAIVPNGVRIPDRVSSEAFLAQNPALGGKRIVLFLGRIHFKKGLDLLVEAWSKIISRHRDVHLVLAGPDFEGTRARIAAMVEEQKMGQYVSFTGMLHDEVKWGALAAAECFVLPSYSEGLSVSVLEAMGAGLPVVVSEACNLPEIAELHAGWVIPAEVAPLERALLEMLEHSPQENAQLGAHGRDFVRKRYAWATVATQMAEVYGWLQGGSLPVGAEVLQPSAGWRAQ